MENTIIYTKRKYETWPSWHIIYEWEEDIAKALNISLVSSEKAEKFFSNKIINRALKYRLVNIFAQKIDILVPQPNVEVVFELYLKDRFAYTSRKNSVPIIIDFWERNDLSTFYNAYANCKLVFISSLEVYSFLKANNCPLNIKHLPLSLSNRYKPIGAYEKKYDILFAGRPNSVLWAFMLAYEKKYPEVEYLYQIEVDKRIFYKSNKKGIIGDFHSREEYISLLRSSKISFYSTPGIDGGETRTNGFNPVTPRFLELIAAGCFVMGRYPDNEETRFYEMEQYCPNVSCFEDFEKYMLSFLQSNSPDLDDYRNYLEKHSTTLMAEQIKAGIKGTFE